MAPSNPVPTPTIPVSPNVPGPLLHPGCTEKSGAYPWSADKLSKCATLSFRLITETMREIAFH